MGFTDVIDNKMKRSKSERAEKKKINERMDSIEDTTDASAEQITLIGQYFWKKYIAGEYTPEEGNRIYFENLDALNARIGELSQEIDDIKIEGIKERELIDDETRRNIQLKADRKAEKAEARARAKSEKEDEMI